MNTQKLKSTTAVILSFALASPHIVTAQTVNSTSKPAISVDLQLAQATVADDEDATKKDKKKKKNKNKNKDDSEKKTNKKKTQADAEAGVKVQDAEAGVNVQADVGRDNKAEADIAAEAKVQAEADMAAKLQADADAERNKQKKQNKKDAKAAETSNSEVKANEITQDQVKAEADKQKKNKNNKKDDTKAGTDAEKADDQGTVAVDDTNTQTADDENGRKKKRKKGDMEAVQTDTDASTEAANTTREVTATQDGKGAKGKKRKETITKKNRRASNQEKAEEVAVSNDDGGLNNLEKFLIGAAGIGILAAVLNNRDKVVETDADRVVVQRGDGDYYVLKDDNALLRQPGSTVETETFADGSSRQTIVSADGTQVVTVRAPNGQVLSRTQYLTNGQTVRLFDDTINEVPVRVADLPRVEEYSYASNTLSDADLRAALMSTRNGDVDRSFSLQQIRQIRAVRELMPVIELSAITFASGSAIIEADQAQSLATVGTAIADLIKENPAEVFLVEGHTDAVGSATSNLSLSDRRAESVALALTEYFGVPAQNLIVQGYGESNLRVPTDAAEEANRRAAVRRITPLLNSSSEG